MSALKLYDFWRSSAAYRLRIAFNLKGVAYTSETVNIAPGADEQFAEAYKAVNPQMRVPSIDVNGKIASQSMAILEWLDETHPEPPLLPADVAADFFEPSFALIFAMRASAARVVRRRAIGALESRAWRAKSAECGEARKKGKRPTSAVAVG